MESLLSIIAHIVKLEAILKVFRVSQTGASISFDFVHPLGKAPAWLSFQGSNLPSGFKCEIRPVAKLPDQQAGLKM